MAKPLVTAEVSRIPNCDFCDRPAAFDGKTTEGPWAYMCEPHFTRFGIGLGMGVGQRLILKS